MGILLIKANDVENWTSKEPRRAQELLPKLIWKLILASSKEIKDHHFPFEDAVQFNGYDGYLETTDSNPFYPQGKSVWECGTNKNIIEKFNEDYKKRSENPNGIDLENTTFCFVTSRIWNHREGIAEFTAKKQADNVWKNIRLIDANNLEMWLNECPSVSMWFSKIIGKENSDLMDLESYWNNIVSSTKPQLTVDFFLIGREKLITEDIFNQIEGNETQIILSAESKIEGILTFAAELLEGKDIKHKQLLSKTIVALSSNGLYNACQNYNNSVIIPAFKNEKEQFFIKGTLIIPTENNSPINLLYKNAVRCTLLNRRHRDFSKALESIGFDANKSYRIANDVKCRFSPLLRKITTDISLKIPSWYENDNTEILVHALLVNAWDSNFDGDREVIELLSGKKYDEYIPSLQPFINGDNAPVFNLDNSYACISANELWDIISSYLTAEDFKRYKECIEFVFSETDPTYQLPKDKWHMSTLYNKQSRFSDRLKKGLIFSMTKIVELGESEKTSKFCVDSVSECRVLVTKIFDKINSKEDWYTVDAYITDFVEAAPDAVMRVIEKNIENASSDFWCLFENLDSSLFGKVYYTNVLWALEKLMWFEKYCVRAVYALVKINEKKFNYKMTNSPIDSLYKFFCLWHPQGALSFEERITLLNEILKKYHFSGRQLVDILFPSGSGVVSNLLELQWKYIDENSLTVTCENYHNSINRVAESFINSSIPCYDDWKIIVKYYSIFIEMFDSLNIDIYEIVDEISDNDKLKLCKDLANKIGRHRKFANEEQNIPETSIKKLEKLYELLLPNSPLKYVHYYSYDFPGINPCVYDKDNYDYEKECSQLQQERIEAFEEIMDEYGFDSIYQIVPRISEIGLLVDSLIHSKYFDDISIDFIKKAQQKIPKFIETLVNSIYYNKGISFFYPLIDDKGEDIEFIIIQLPITTDVIAFIDKLSDDNKFAYWENVNVWGLTHQEKMFAQNCFRTLLQFNRPYSVMKQLYLDKVADSEIILQTLYKGLEKLS